MRYERTGDKRRSLSRATSDDGVPPTELLETINIFCSLGCGAILVVLVPNRLVALGVGDLEFFGVAPVCIIRGILLSLKKR